MALSVVSLDWSRRVLYNDTLFEVLGPPVWPMDAKCTLVNLFKAKNSYNSYNVLLFKIIQSFNLNTEEFLYNEEKIRS
jgi:hypothetical protein